MLEVVAAEFPGYWRQRRGQEAVWELHHWSGWRLVFQYQNVASKGCHDRPLVPWGTVLGSICAEAKLARPMAATENCNKEYILKTFPR